MSASSIFVQWDQVPSQYQNGVILYYTVTYYRRHYSSSFPQRVVVAAPTTQTTLTGLNQGALYSISVSASNIRGDGPVASISIVTGKNTEFPYLTRLRWRNENNDEKGKENLIISKYGNPKGEGANCHAIRWQGRSRESARAAAHGGLIPTRVMYMCTVMAALRG